MRYVTKISKINSKLQKNCLTNLKIIPNFANIFEDLENTVKFDELIRFLINFARFFQVLDNTFNFGEHCQILSNFQQKLKNAAKFSKFF